MRYEDPELREQLAGEYVLGALRGAARSRFERLVQQDPDLQNIVVRWQENLTPLNEETPEVPPPARVLEHLTRKIAPESRADKTGLWQRLSFWRPLAVLNAALAVTVAGYLGFKSFNSPEIAQSELLYVGVLSDQQERPAVAVLAYNNPWRLVLESKVPLNPDANSVLRLLIVENDNGARRLLTTLLPGSKEVRLDEQSWKLLKNASSLIVSQAPSGNTIERLDGPILYSGVCINLKNWSSERLVP